MTHFQAGSHDGGPRRAPSRGDSGASATEYGLLISAIAGVMALVIFAFGDNVADLFTDTCSSLASQTSADC